VLGPSAKKKGKSLLGSLEDQSVSIIKQRVPDFFEGKSDGAGEFDLGVLPSEV
jgi:hypothetical protein